jgi:undecaprenyl diphosphate synthase
MPCGPSPKQVADGTLTPGQINEEIISNRLYTAGMPDPDLLIRTAGEMRVSNYLLWQISYAELVVSPVLWPDFGVRRLVRAIAEFSRATAALVPWTRLIRLIIVNRPRIFMQATLRHRLRLAR